MSHNEQEPQPSGESASASGKSPNRSRKTPGLKSVYFLGAASGAALALFAPMFRPAAKSAVKGGILVGRQAKKLAFNVKEEFEDIATEAQAELDHGSGPSSNGG